MSGAYSVSLDQIEWVRKNCGPELWNAVDLLTARSGWDILIALESVIRERDTLLDRLNSEIPPPGYEVIEFGSTSGPNSFPRIQRKGPNSWAIYADSMYCYGKDGNFHPEPLPSSRSDEFIALTRFSTPREAADALSSGEAGKEREA